MKHIDNDNDYYLFINMYIMETHIIYFDKKKVVLGTKNIHIRRTIVIHYRNKNQFPVFFYFCFSIKIIKWYRYGYIIYSRTPIYLMFLDIWLIFRCTESQYWLSESIESI